MRVSAANRVFVLASLAVMAVTSIAQTTSAATDAPARELNDATAALTAAQASVQEACAAVEARNARSRDDCHESPGGRTLWRRLLARLSGETRCVAPQPAVAAPAIQPIPSDTALCLRARLDPLPAPRCTICNDRPCSGDFAHADSALLVRTLIAARPPPMIGTDMPLIAA